MPAMATRAAATDFSVISGVRQFSTMVRTRGPFILPPFR